MRRLAALLVVGLVLVASGCCGPCGGRAGCGYAPASGYAPATTCAPGCASRTNAAYPTMCCPPNSVNACYY